MENNATQTSVAFTLKGHKSGVNCSYFNMNTRKLVPPGYFNRPFIVIKDGKLIISDNKEDLVNDKVYSGGSWLMKDSKPYSTDDHFSKDFRNMLVKRTMLGTDKNENVYLIVITNANFYKMRKLAEKLQLVNAINLDGGTSSILKYNGKIYVQGEKRVVNYLVFD